MQAKLEGNITTKRVNYLINNAINNSPQNEIQALTDVLANFNEPVLILSNNQSFQKGSEPPPNNFFQTFDHRTYKSGSTRLFFDIQSKLPLGNIIRVLAPWLKNHRTWLKTQKLHSTCHAKVGFFLFFHTKITHWQNLHHNVHHKILKATQESIYNNVEIPEFDINIDRELSGNGKTRITSSVLMLSTATKDADVLQLMLNLTVEKGHFDTYK